MFLFLLGFRYSERCKMIPTHDKVLGFGLRMPASPNPFLREPQIRLQVIVAMVEPETGRKCARFFRGI